MYRIYFKLMIAGKQSLRGYAFDPRYKDWIDGESVIFNKHMKEVSVARRVDAKVSPALAHYSSSGQPFTHAVVAMVDPSGRSDRTFHFQMEQAYISLGAAISESDGIYLEPVTIGYEKSRLTNAAGGPAGSFSPYGMLLDAMQKRAG
jgi:hypothetical protein